MAQHCAPPFLNMSGGEDRLKRLVLEAAGVLAVTNGNTKIVNAMKFVGFTTPERKDMKLYQRVRRSVAKVDVVVEEEKKRGVAVTVTLPTNGISNSQETRVSTLTPGTGTTTADTSSSGSSSDSSNAEPRRLITESLPASTKIYRRTAREVQRGNASFCSQKTKDKTAMKQATVMIVKHLALPRGHPAKLSIGAICKLINERLDSNISAKTAARYARTGLVGCSPLKKGPVGDFPPHIQCIERRFRYLPQVGAISIKEAVEYQGFVEAGQRVCQSIRLQQDKRRPDAQAEEGYCRSV